MKWRRTYFGKIGGITVTLADDWTLFVEGLMIARIYHVTGGPQNGLWLWFVQVRPNGKPGNGGRGEARTKEEAMAACEQLLPEAIRQRLWGPEAGVSQT